MRTIKIINEPFFRLDSYQEESYVWAKMVTKRIDSSFFNEKDPLIISASFAYIHGSFTHFTVNNFMDGFRYYVQDDLGEIIRDAWNRMLNCVGEIYSAMKVEYEDDYQIFLSLRESILFEDYYYYGDHRKIEPFNFDGAVRGLSFVNNQFSY